MLGIEMLEIVILEIVKSFRKRAGFDRCPPHLPCATLLVWRFLFICFLEGDRRVTWAKQSGNNEFVVEQRAGAITALPRAWFFDVVSVFLVLNFLVNGGPIHVEETMKYIHEEKGMEKLR